MTPDESYSVQIWRKHAADLPTAFCYISVHTVAFCKINAFAEDDCCYGNMGSYSLKGLVDAQLKCPVMSLEPCFFYEPTQTYKGLPSNSSNHIYPPKDSVHEWHKYCHAYMYF